MREFWIQGNEAGQRFDKYLKKLLCNASAGFIYKMLRKKNIVLNDKKADGAEKLQLNDNVKLYFSEETYQKFTVCRKKEETAMYLPEIDLGKLPFQVLYENTDVIIINKPIGMLSQKAGASDISANEYILAYLIAARKWNPDGLHTFRPSVCNRLDRNTAGILIAGKTLYGLQKISEGLRMRTIQKYYRCIVEGVMTDSSHLKGYLRKDEIKNQVFISEKKMSEEDKLIETEYRPICNFSNTTVLEVHLITGRTHQIRAHLSSIGHPIVGDVKYGALRRKGISAQLLYACRICMEDGTEIEAPPPKEFQRAIEIYHKE